MSLDYIENLTKEHAADRDVVAERVQLLHAEMGAVKKRRLAGIKSAVSKARDSKLRLASAIEHEKRAFDKPRTRVFHGIKVGLQKAKGKLQFLDATKVVELIKKHFADQVDVLIKKTEKPRKAALTRLPATDLKKLGCSIADTGDEVVIEPINTEIDELVEALLKDGSEESAEDDDE